MEKPLIDIAGLRAERLESDRRFRLSVPEFRLEAGDRVAVIGPSGSGKSTFLETVACTRAPKAGGRFLARVTRDGSAQAEVDVADAWTAARENALTRLRAEMFGYVHQTGGLLEFLSVRDNIALTQRFSGRIDPDAIDRLGRFLGIHELFASLPRHLSGGQRQRVAIARALAHGPMVVIADEPTASLDRTNARLVMELLRKAADTTGAALLVATHDEVLIREFDFSKMEIRDESREDGPPGGAAEAGQTVVLVPFGQRRDA